ncbi:MAG: HU family DNA-binding protein [Bacteroides sp.]|nr:HU family DNA-binding protein [Bacteroides sp.]
MNEKITLQDLINLFSEKQGISKKDAELFVRSLFDLIEEALAAEKYVKVKGLGTFKLTEVDSRESVNVNTGERIEIQGHTKVSFTPDTTMKDLINKPFAHFETVILNDGVELEDTPVEVPEALEMEEVVAPIVEIPTEVKIPVQEEVSEIVVVNEEVAAEGVVPKIVMVEEPETAESEIVEESDVIEELQLEIGEKVSIPEEIQVPEETPQENHQTETVEVPEEDKRIFIEEKISEEKNVTESKEKSINRVLWGVIVVLVLIILFGVYWMFLRPSDTPEVIPAEVVQEEVVMPISVVEEKKQEEVLKTIQFIELSEEELRKERVPSFADTLDYQIVGTQTEHTLQQGETIIRASVRFFGTKKYWPYIVKHNKDVLKDPDNIPAGIRLKIPKLVEKK